MEKHPVSMNDSINLSSMAADSAAALQKLTKDLRELRKMIEVRALKNNARKVTISPADLPEMDPRQLRH